MQIVSYHQACLSQLANINLLKLKHQSMFLQMFLKKPNQTALILKNKLKELLLYPLWPSQKLTNVFSSLALMSSYAWA